MPACCSAGHIGALSGAMEKYSRSSDVPLKMVLNISDVFWRPLEGDIELVFAYPRYSMRFTMC